MKLVDAVKQYEECMRGGGGSCPVENCPLAKDMKFLLSTEDGETAYMKMECCSVVGRLKRFLAGKKPGEPAKSE